MLLALLVLLSGCSQEARLAADLGGRADALLDAPLVDALHDARFADSAADRGAPGQDTAVDLLGKDGGGQDGSTLSFELTVMAANLTSGTAQSYTPGHGARIIEAFAPDVVLIQEFNYGAKTAADISTFVSSTLGAGYHYVRGNGSIPNGVISRYPILASGVWVDPEVSNRDFTWARIDLPGAKDLYAISVHLLTSKASKRTKEVKALLAFIQQHVPSGALLVLGGDFNTTSRGEGCIAALRQRFTIAAPYPADQSGNGHTNAHRNSPYDWVVVSPALHALEVPLRVGSQSFAAGLVFDSRVYTPLSEVPPVLIGDSDAPQMQHMAVLRRFHVTP
ncbi:MAG: endonuclease [Proteobacteria bacterium]|nr:MAG: endonuclease [Pseudomonadota bacterium]